MQKSICFVWMVILIFIATADANASTFVNRVGPGGAIQDVVVSQSAAWSIAGSPYIVEGHVTVAAAATLTIENGVVVNVNAGRGLFVNGVVVASGATLSINCTGNWLGIYLSPASGSSSFRNCVIERAGANYLGYIHNAYRLASVYVDGCSPVIANTIVRDTAGHGIELFDSAATCTNNTFNNIADGYYGVVLDTLGAFPIMGDNQAAGTGVHGIYVPGGGNGGTKTLRKAGPGFAFFLCGDHVVA